MNIQRGDVIKARFPHVAGGRGKKRPVIVVQGDTYNQKLRHAVVVQLTSNLDEKDDPACYFIEANSPEGQSAGLQRDSLVLGYMLATLAEDLVSEQIGSLPEQTMQQIEECIKTALDMK